MKHRQLERERQIPPPPPKKFIQRQIDRLKRQIDRLKRPFQFFEHVIGLVAAFAAILGVGFWWAERGDRNEERRLRKAELIADARTTLASAAATGVVDAESDPMVAFAIQVLADYRQPIILKSESVSLGGVDLDCAEILIEAEFAEIAYSNVGRSIIHWYGKKLEIVGTDFVDSFLVLESTNSDLSSVADFTTPKIVTFRDTRWLGGRLDLPLEPWLDLTTINMSDARFKKFEVSEGIATYRYAWINADSQKYVLEENSCVDGSSAGISFDCPSVGGEPHFENVPHPPACKFPDDRIRSQTMREAMRLLDRAIFTMDDK
jgi:hypothetical protein